MASSHLPTSLALNTARSKWMSRGITPDCGSRTLILAALSAPVIVRRHLSCNVVSLAADPRLYSLVRFVECLTAAPYVMVGRTTAVCT